MTAAEYLTDFKPKRVVLGIGTLSLLTPLRFFRLCQLNRSRKYSLTCLCRSYQYIFCLQLTTFLKISLFACSTCSALPLIVNPSSSLLADLTVAPDCRLMSSITHPSLPMTRPLKSLETGTYSLCIAFTALGH